MSITATWPHFWQRTPETEEGRRVWHCPCCGTETTRPWTLGCPGRGRQAEEDEWLSDSLADDPEADHGDE